MCKLSPKSVSVISAILMLSALVGCGGGSKVYLPTNTGSPTPSAGSPVVTSLSPSTAVAGGPAFTLTVTGKNFAPGMTVGGIATTGTTYVSSTEMQAQVPASAIASPGSVTIIAVTNPPSTLNFGVAFTITIPPLSGNSGFTISNVAIQANDMVWDPTSQQIYLSVAGGNSTNGNTIAALNPANGQIGISQAAGGTPDKLAISSDDSYLYAGLDSAGTVQRFILPNLGTDISIPLGSYSVSGLGTTTNYGPYYAMDVEVAPGSPHTIAVVRGVMGLSPREMGGVVIYDDAAPRPTSVPGFGHTGAGTIDSIQWSFDATHIYGEDTEGGSDLYVLSVNSSGVQETNDYAGVFGGSGYGNLHYDATTGYVYGDNGQVIDPSTGTIVGSFPTSTVQGGFAVNGVMVPDGTLNIAYFIGQTQDEGGTQEYAVEAFDLTQFTLLGAISIPNVVGTPVKLIRWGTDGLAFLTSNGPGGPAQGDGVYLISGAFVTSPAAQSKATSLHR